MSPSGTGAGPLPPWWSRWLGAFKRGWPPASHQRLAASLAAYRDELDYLSALPVRDPAGCSWGERAARSALSLTRREQVPPGGQTPRTWDEFAGHLLSAAQDALARGDIELGWKCFHAARRVEVFGLAERRPEGLEPRAQAVLDESLDKLTSWRQRTVVALLGRNDPSIPGVVLARPLGPDGPCRIYEASEILHEHYANGYHKVRAAKRLVGTLSLVAVACTAAILGFGFTGADDARLAPLRVVLFGVLGAAFSGLVAFARGTERRSIPDEILTFVATVARLAAGAVGALAAYVLLRSGVIPVEQDRLAWFALAVAFAAGFSERLVVRAVEGISGEGRK